MHGKRGPRRTGVTRRSDDRAVSEVIAFVLTFSIIITSVGVVSAVGFSVLQGVQEDEQALNAQRGFQTLADSFGEIDRGHAPSRSGEISLSDGVVFTRTGSASNSTLDVEIGISGPNRTYANDVGTLLYRSEGEQTTIGIQSGAVFRKDKFSDRAVMVQSPSFACTDDVAIVSLVVFESDTNVRGGDGTVQITASEQSSTLLWANSSAQNVTVEYGGNRFNESWAGYFEDEEGWSENGGSAICEVGGSGTVIVRRTVIEINFVG